MSVSNSNTLVLLFLSALGIITFEWRKDKFAKKLADYAVIEFYLDSR